MIIKKKANKISDRKNKAVSTVPAPGSVLFVLQSRQLTKHQKISKFSPNRTLRRVLLTYRKEKKKPVHFRTRTHDSYILTGSSSPTYKPAGLAAESGNYQE